MNERVVKNPNFKNNGEFHRSLMSRGAGAKDWPNSHTEVEHLGNGKFGASIGVGHRVFFDKADGNKPKKHKLTDDRPAKDYILIQGPKCCVEVYPYYAKYFDVQHEEVRVEEERWVVQRLFKEPDEWRDVDAYNPVMVIEEYPEPAGDVVKVTVTYDTDYGILTVEYFQRDGNNLKHNVTFKNTSGSTETFRVLQRWAGIVGDKCNEKEPPTIFGKVEGALYCSEITSKILAHEPESVLDIGGGTGEVTKFLEERGISATCMEASNECLNNRVTDNFILHDISDTPWPFADEQFDLCTGFGALKYVPEQALESVLLEIARVTKRGFFGVGYGAKLPPSDCGEITLLKPADWWLAKFNDIIPDFPVEVLSLTPAERALLLAFHRADKSQREFTIAENLSSMVSNPDGSEKTDQCLKKPISVEAHAQGMKADFIYGSWTLAQDGSLMIDPDTATLDDPTVDGYTTAAAKSEIAGEILIERAEGGGEKYRGYVEWDIISIPDGATITSTIFKYEGLMQNVDCFIREMLGAQPSISTALAVWNEIGEGTIYADPDGFPILGINQSQDLGSSAVSDLQSQLSVDWFAIGVQSEAGDDVQSSIASEEKPGVPPPTLYVEYTTYLPGTRTAHMAAKMMGARAI